MEKMIAKKTILISGLIVLILGFSFFLMGCASQQVEEPVEDPLRVFGVETSTSAELNAKNETGNTIVGLSIKNSTALEYPESLVKNNQGIDADEEVILYFEPEVDAASEAEKSTERASDIVLNTLYNMLITFEGGTQVELHDMDLPELSRVHIYLSEEGIGYIEYDNDEGVTESTLETEKALIVAAAAKAEAEAQAAAEAAAAAESAANQTYESGSNYGSTYDYGSSDSSGSASGSQSEDQCVDDLVLN